MRYSLMSLAFCVFAAPAAAFDGWKEQKFSLFGGNDWQRSAAQVTVASDSTVSMLWTELPQSQWETRRASWAWDVRQSVPATALDQKGGDDRNLSLYFVFMPEDIARASRGKSIRQLLSIEEARVLMYVHGGNHGRGAVLPSPYLGARGKTIALRPAGEGAHRESVDLAADHKRAFGQDAGVLVGLAISADSDDTKSTIDATLSNLSLN